MKKVLFFSLIAFSFLVVIPIFADNGNDPAPVTVASIQVFPPMAFTRYGGEVEFTARAYDKDGNWLKDLDLTGCWTTSAGLIDDFGRYIANVVGYHTVTCTYTGPYEAPIGTPLPIEPVLIEGTASVDVGEERPR
ncbi:MAG: hypothetical protein A2Z91_03705 [Deltaproteobacteria bacterium GWA2_38_16]|nr:MAG: hypothetical protein A2Z91_03705 [Deltaproteobacteria bacterium GWA2_38_16]OGQ02138.1 MAG: hypothetical protein A3D19_00425 [Deltaproteobacteria bacterium RIFCSPHIGHO2_02_FULL_38_15]OGQ34190.1 MAG: hypothetical protein A3A72_02780 [Deltaproteobacteria bacterium RIFCSPLOWO2_01_FULL_38_9]OGQ60568.1 MAG: hypothetical protein A3G92_01605 [Deltaproteobacteria bacterium RIFCSPLOWO2_12_FULL_38_8]